MGRCRESDPWLSSMGGEIERSMRGAAGVIVLLSPASNNSEWVRREISFAEQHEKRIFPVLVSGDEDDSVPLRLSNHQRVDLRSNFDAGMEELAHALNDDLGTTKVIRRQKQGTKQPNTFIPADLKKFVLPGLIALLALICIGGLAVAACLISVTINNSLPTPAVTITSSTEPFILATAQDISTNEEPTGKIVYTCQVQGDEICIINADGSGWQRLTDFPSASNYASLSPAGDAALFVGRQTGNAEIYQLISAPEKSSSLFSSKRM